MLLHLRKSIPEIAGQRAAGDRGAKRAVHLAAIGSMNQRDHVLAEAGFLVQIADAARGSHGDGDVPGMDGAVGDVSRVAVHRARNNRRALFQPRPLRSFLRHFPDDLVAGINVRIFFGIQAHLLDQFCVPRPANDVKAGSEQARVGIIRHCLAGQAHRRIVCGGQDFIGLLIQFRAVVALPHQFDARVIGIDGIGAFFTRALLPNVFPHPIGLPGRAPVHPDMAVLQGPEIPVHQDARGRKSADGNPSDFPRIDSRLRDRIPHRIRHGVPVPIRLMLRPTGARRDQRVFDIRASQNAPVFAHYNGFGSTSSYVASHQIICHIFSFLCPGTSPENSEKKPRPNRRAPSPSICLPCFSRHSCRELYHTILH